MKYFSTRNPEHVVTFREAVLSGLAPDGGLYMPESLPRLSAEVLERMNALSMQEVSTEITKVFASEDIDDAGIERIIESAINFPAPVHFLAPDIASLELFHGPSMAFKDFGARFMAQTMSWFTRNDNDPLHILVATSGDTGGAVALGFYKVPGVEVSILYPKGRVSELQEKQLTTHGHNIHAYEVEGSFDDCQRMVKEAFQDKDIRSRLRLTSANSINISRLIPQTFYYFNAVNQIDRVSDGNRHRPLVFSIPSGNFGNLCAGVMAKKLGARIDTFLAATNVNDTVPRYLASGEYSPMESIATISNAMDVGTPSNFERLLKIFSGDHQSFCEWIIGYRYSDEETKYGMAECHEKYHYISDPHGAIGYLACRDHLASRSDNPVGVFLETAHPIKFPDSVENAVKVSIPTPPQVGTLLEREKKAYQIPAKLDALKQHLLV
ncbi:MAG: threonine synthase [Bdellovibrionales bacterium]|nr:threonine synthase [Bdellovibrionales bacterium]